MLGLQDPDPAFCPQGFWRDSKRCCQEKIRILMRPNISPIWLQLPEDLFSRTKRCIAAACEPLPGKNEGVVFFRTDDVAVPGKNFTRLLKLFAQNRAPLCLAVVPARLTALRWQSLNAVGRDAAALRCWHQHGWRHVNHEPKMKQEFGSARTESEIRRDLLYGKQRLEALMQDAFYPVFTPPWNGCSSTTLNLLRDLGYVAVSRSRRSQPAPPDGLPDIAVDVDLHTRKEANPNSDWNRLFAELEQAISAGRCGFMIHHQRMNDAAFDFLEILLKLLAMRREVQLVHFKELIDRNRGLRTQQT
jgi:peptidoglycan/xylan/chitin deacetylase (PgdA/CDA1 family)